MKRLSPDDHVKRVAGFVFGIILASCGSVIVVMSLKTQMKANQSIHWTQVQGKIISDTMHQGDGAEFRMIHYQYSVGDKAFEGDRLCFGVDSAAMDRIAATGQNTQVTVFVNPAMPQESVLVPGIFGGRNGFFCGRGRSNRPWHNYLVCYKLRLRYF